MADHTKIEWSDATWNPITGCFPVSPGCTNCYAMRQAGGGRVKNHPSRVGLTRQVNGKHVWTGEVRLNGEWLDQPLRWRRPRMIFVCAHGDLFAEGVPDEWIDQVFAVMALCPQHVFQVLTKRPERMRDYLRRFKPSPISDGFVTRDGIHSSDSPRGWPIFVDWPLPNVWLGVSVEDQRRADERIPILLDTPAAIRWISAEPLLGPVDLTEISTSSDGYNLRLNSLSGACRHKWHKEFAGPGYDPGKYGMIDSTRPHLDWVVAGGESGPDARPMHPDWPRLLRNQCAAAQVPFLFKQWGDWLPWEPEHGPCWISQNGRCEDQHNLFPVDFDHAPEWDDGLWAIDGAFTHAVFQRVRKRAAGRLLDGVEHNGFPDITNRADGPQARPGVADRSAPRPERSGAGRDSARTR